MCVAAIIHTAVPMNDLQNMENDNPHGAGVAWAEDGMLHFRKGLTAKQIFDMQETGEVKFPYMCHFRWTTHGVTEVKMTHPFPLGARALMGELQGTADKLMMHNGVWSKYIDYIGYLEEDPALTAEMIADASDTCVAAYLMESIWPHVGEQMSWAVAIATLDESGQMQVEKHGYCWETHEGNEYSNLGWIPRKMSDYTKYFSDWRATKRQSNREFMRAWSEYETEDKDFHPRNAGDWDDYIRARYGDDVANEVKSETTGVADDSMTIEQMERAETLRELNDEQNPWDAVTDAYIQGLIDDAPNSDVDLEDIQDAMSHSQEDLVSEDFEDVNSFLAEQMISLPLIRVAV